MKLLILGAGEYGQLVKELARNKYTTIDFLDDKSEAAIGKFEDYRKLKDNYSDAVVAIGNSEVLMEWLGRLKEAGYNLPLLLSERAFVSPSAVIEEGCIIEPMTTINANAKVEKGSIVSSGAVVNHNAIVKQGCHIDCNSVVGADAVVPEKMNLNYGQVITKVTKPENWEFSE
ncbi:MAG: hypothetical protein J6X93_06380 [Bacilli bacterium]|nr:hypothetical protein [Bacilli bacterium]